MSLVDFFWLPHCPVGENLGLSQRSQQSCRDCQRCKCELWRLFNSSIIWCIHLCNQVHFAFEESLARLQGDSKMHMSRRRCWPFYPCWTMICSLKGISVQVNSEGLGQGFCLRCQPLSNDSNWLQDVLLGVALFLVQLSTAAAWMELQTRIRPHFGTEPSNARAHLEGLCLGFHLTCYPLF